VTTTPVTITASSGAVQGTASMSVSAAQLTGIQLNPSTASLAKGRTQQFDIIPTYTDGTHSPIPSVTWSSSDTSKVSISSAGLATALAVTTLDVTITATSGTISNTATVTVTPAVLDTLVVSPSSISKAKGLTQQFSVTPTYSDGTHTPMPVITWSSSDTSKVTIDNATAIATANNVTTTPVTITASSVVTENGVQRTVTGSAAMDVTPAQVVSLPLLQRRPTSY